MRAIPTRIHAGLDYALAALMIGLPWLAGFARGGAETWAPVGIGVALAVYALATDYELGALKRLQMPVHLWVDGLAGFLLAASPWLLEFDRIVRVPHLVVGLALVVIAISSDTIPGYERRRGDRSDPG